MNRKLNTVLFMIGATIYLLIILCILFILSFIICAWLFSGDELLFGIFFSIFTILCLAGGFFIYNFTLRLLSKKVDLDKYFAGLIKKK